MCQLSRNYLFLFFPTSRRLIFIYLFLCIFTASHTCLPFSFFLFNANFDSKKNKNKLTFYLKVGTGAAGRCAQSAVLIKRPREFDGYVRRGCRASESEHHAVGTRACQENAHNTGDKAEERIFNSVWASEVIHSHSRDTLCAPPPPWLWHSLTHSHQSKSHHARENILLVNPLFFSLFFFLT